MKSLIAGLLLIGVATAQAADHQPCTDQMAKGEKCACKLGELHPTQSDVGMAHVAGILDDARDKAKKGKDGNTAAEVLQHHAEKSSTTVLVGHDGRFYVIDGPHHAVALLREL